jgi:hypothetical protein
MTVGANTSTTSVRIYQYNVVCFYLIGISRFSRFSISLFQLMNLLQYQRDVFVQYQYNLRSAHDCFDSKPSIPCPAVRDYWSTVSAPFQALNPFVSLRVHS